MDILEAIEIIESWDGTYENRQECLTAWQYLIDTGAVWDLQGSYVRGARQLINSGLCTLKKSPKQQQVYA